MLDLVTRTSESILKTPNIYTTIVCVIMIHSETRHVKCFSAGTGERAADRKWGGYWDSKAPVGTGRTGSVLLVRANEVGIWFHVLRKPIILFFINKTGHVGYQYVTTFCALVDNLKRCLQLFNG